MRDRWNRFKENRDLAAVNTLISAAKAIGAALIFLLPAGIVTQIEVPIWVKVACVGIIICLFLVACGFFLGRRRNPIRQARYRQNVNAKLETVERHEFLDVLSYTTYELFYTLKLKVIGEFEECYSFYTEWTGKDDLEIKVGNPGFKAIQGQRVPPVTRLWKIMFDRRRYRGEIFELRYSIYTEGNIREDENFISHSFRGTDCPKAATLSVRFSPNVEVTKVWTEQYFPSDATAPDAPGVERECGESRLVAWTFPTEPERRFCLRWTYAEPSQG